VKKSEQLLFILLIIQPIIDLMTSLMTHYNDTSTSIGALVRTMMMAILFIYIVQYIRTKKRNIMWLFICSFASIVLMLTTNVILKDPFSLYAELNFALKTSYYLVMIFTVIILIDKQLLNQAFIFKATNIITAIIGISYWLAVITNTGINSYTYGEKGYSGWFYSANELSVIVIILFGLSIVQLSFKKGPSSWVSFILMLSMLPMVGTKTAFYGGMLILFTFTGYLLLTFNIRLLRDKSQLVFLGIVSLFLFITPFSPIFSNTEQLDMRIKQENKPNVDHTAVQQSTFMTKLLSSRDIYLQTTKEDFIHAEGLRKAFGLGYAGNYMSDPKIIEMDFFDMFFSYGVIGTLFLLLPLVYLCVKMLTFPIHIEKALLLFTLCLCFGIAFLAGHVIFAPSVMTYLAILFLAMGFKNDNQHVGEKK